MEKILQKAKWIWCHDNPMPDEYGEFVDHFTYESGEVVLQISADSNYAVYINGELASWGQYADFPYDKVYDEVDVTAFCKEGENRLAIIVWYYGTKESFTYYPGKAGLLYALSCGEELLCMSGIHTLARKSLAYQNQRQKYITVMIGFGYGYDMRKEDEWLTGGLVGFKPATIVEQTLPLRKRPCDKLHLRPEVCAKECKRISDTDVIYDLGSEQVGLLSFVIDSSCEQEITVAFGEHLVDGCVRKEIEMRDFSVSIWLKQGENAFFNPFRRFGCRYLEVFSEKSLDIKKMAIAPTVYELQEKSRPVLSQLQEKIYDMCIETLHLCMHEHYEDCPWREQSLYAMDSRNQMLCGYYAFGEYTFPKANLQLIAKDNREDGLLSICYPMKVDLVIPSFALHYITACREYLQYSGDKEFLKSIYSKLVSIIETFTNRMKDGVLLPFPGVNNWNFYEWRDGLDGGGPYCETYDCDTPELLLNTFLSYALKNMAVITDVLEIKNTYRKQAEKLNARIYELFYDKGTKVCYDTVKHEAKSQLGNALAILCGAVKGEEARSLCDLLQSDEEMTPISLSMICFKYDAWLMTDKEHFAPIILKDIERLYIPMIEFGSTTVWETEDGESDFDNAGSLCHGWSALPIYYYHTLLK